MKVLAALVICAVGASPDSAISLIPINGSRVGDVIAINGTFPDKDGCSDNAKLVRLFGDGREVWSVDIEGPYLHDPVVGADGTVYLWTGCGLELCAFRPDGSLKWKVNNFNYYAGIKHMPPVVGPDGTVYAIYSRSQTHHDLLYHDQLYALSNVNGSELWRYNLDVIDSGAVPVVAADGTVIVSAGGLLRGISPDGAHDLWSFNVSRDDSSDPAVAPDGTVYICSTHSVYAIDPAQASVPSQNNMVKWQFELFTSGTCRQQAGTENAGKKNSPFIDQNGDVYWSGRRGSVYEDTVLKFGPGGEIVWWANPFDSTPPKGCYGSPYPPVVSASAAGPVLWLSAHIDYNPETVQLLAINATDGHTMWQADMHDLRSKPAADAGHVVAYFAEDSLVSFGQIMAYDYSGDVEWSYPSFRSPASAFV